MDKGTGIAKIFKFRILRKLLVVLEKTSNLKMLYHHIGKSPEVLSELYQTFPPLQKTQNQNKFIA